jgi:hypothetical protein
MTDLSQGVTRGAVRGSREEGQLRKSAGGLYVIYYFVGVKILFANNF